jgi:drug/metabolite transporter (DMT)-like permease
MQFRPLEAGPALKNAGLHLPLEIWLALLGLALLSTALAYLIYFQILATAGATNVLLVTLLVPISALALGALFLHERLEWTSYAGMAFVFVALALIDGRAIPFAVRASARVGSQVRQLAQRVVERAY